MASRGSDVFRPTRCRTRGARSVGTLTRSGSCPLNLPLPKPSSHPSPRPGASKRQRPSLTCEIADGVAQVRLNRPGEAQCVEHGVDVGTSRPPPASPGEGLRAVVLAGNSGPSAPGSTSASRGCRASFRQRASARPQRAPTSSRRRAGPGVDPGAGHRSRPRHLLRRRHPALRSRLRFPVHHPDAQWSVMSKWGLVPDMSAFALSQLVRIDVAKRMSMTGEIVSGAGGGTRARDRGGDRSPHGRKGGGRDPRPLTRLGRREQSGSST